MSTPDRRFAAPTPFARLLYSHAVMVCGDAALTVSLAGSLFFQSPTSAARGKVLLYLLLTMAPFAVVAPVLGPALDRTKGGRRLLVILSAVGRALLCVFMAMYISKPAPEGLLVYPLAFGVLVLAKGYQIAKSALLPTLVVKDEELVNANSRLALVALIGATVGGLPAAGIQQLFGSDWSLRFAAVIFVFGAILASKLPRTRARDDPDHRQEKLERAELHEPSILLAGSAMAILRGSVGFLSFFAAFSLKSDLFALGVVLSVSALGGFIGVIAAPVLRRSFREEVIVASALVLPAVFAVLGALAGGGLGFALAAIALAVGAAGGRLGFDSLLQRDGPDAVRGRAFARFETRFQLVWVIGGIVGIIPFAEGVGLFILAIALGFAAISYVAALRAARTRESRTKLMPEAVDRAIMRGRDRAMGEMRSRFRRRPKGPAPPDDTQPDTVP
ncbi:MAG: MFS transporter [Acidimicrobiia bacterium]